MRTAMVMTSGVVVAAIGLGAVLSAAGGDTRANTKPVTLPANLGGYRDIVAVVARKSKKVAQQQRRHQATVNATTVAEYRQAYGGAAVAYHAYADSGLKNFPWAIAIRAPAPGLTEGPVSDFKYLGETAPDRSVQTVGDVRCVVVLEHPQLAPQKPDLSSETAVLCRRSDRGLTVETGGFSLEGPGGVRRAAAFTDAAWAAAAH
jgi:hypothetical protein